MVLPDSPLVKLHDNASLVRFSRAARGTFRYLKSPMGLHSIPSGVQDDTMLQVVVGIVVVKVKYLAGAQIFPASTPSVE